MSDFSASDAALEGFQVIRAQWRVVLGWAGFNLLAMVAVVVTFVVVGVTTVSVAGGDPGQIGQTVGGPVVGLTTVVVQLMIGMALFRAIFRPDDRGFFYLRLGPDELRAIGASLVLLLGVAALALIAVTLAVVGFHELGGLAGPEGFRNHPGLFLLQAVAPFVFGPFAIAIGWTPWAAAYQALTTDGPDAPES